MDGNKDGALRCVNIAKEAIAAGNKQRALKFIKIACRLNHNLSVDDLLSACGNLGTSESAGPSTNAENVTESKDNTGSVNSGDGILRGESERKYTEEHVQLVRRIKGKKDYYEILGVEKSCSVEEIRKAYRKLSLKIHPDKNKAPGSDEAFKKVGKAFKCLSDGELRKLYDQTGGFSDEVQYGHVRPRRRRRTRNEFDFFDDDFDPDNIFRAFFSQRHVFGNAHGYRTRAGDQQRAGPVRSGPVWNVHGPILFLLLNLVPVLVLVLFAFLPSLEPEYSLQRNFLYELKKTTTNHGVEFFVKSPEFDEKHPHGSVSRYEIEINVMKDYRQMLDRYCQMELQRRRWNRHFPTPHCDRFEVLRA